MVDRHMKVREVFDAALDRPTEQRATFVHAACAEDSSLFEEVEGLLAAHQASALRLEPNETMQPEAARASRAYSVLNTYLGPYRIIEKLGKGGMADVFLGERQIGKVQQSVAVKVMCCASAHPEKMMARFEQEREILAVLDHPNIAHLIDLGTTEQGLPYFVMDYVRGEPINVFCDREKLGISERLLLFRKVCAAVDYAHRRGIIHRDLKPSNILVTPDGSPKLLDFGIAKLAVSGGPEHTRLTDTGWNPMTLDYASPEQIKGEPVTARTDVYSLGVILYDLLTGHWPYRLTSSAPHDMLRSICEDPPAVASVISIEPLIRETPGGGQITTSAEQLSAVRGECPGSLRRQLKGDIDSILAKALRKEPEWRYQSAEQFGSDIRRYLDGLPLIANQGKLRYSFQRSFRLILHPNGKGLHHNAVMLLCWGNIAGLLLARFQVVKSGLRSGDNWSAWIAPILVCVLLSLREGWRIASSGKNTALDRQVSVVYRTVIAAVASVSLLTGVTAVMSREAVGVLWCVCTMIGLCIVGLQASRLLLLGSVILFISLIFGSLDAAHIFAYLCAGFYLGVCAPGVVLLSRRTDI